MSGKPMTLEQVRDWHLGRAELHREEAYPRAAQRHQRMADAIDVHLTQAAQSVDVEKVKEVIAELSLSDWPVLMEAVKKLTAALQEKGNE